MGSSFAITPRTSVSEKTAIGDRFTSEIWDTLYEISESDQVSDQIEKLISCLEKETLSTTEIMQFLSLSHRATFQKKRFKSSLRSWFN